MAAGVAVKTEDSYLNIIKKKIEVRKHRTGIKLLLILASCPDWLRPLLPKSTRVSGHMELRGRENLQPAVTPPQLSLVACRWSPQRSPRGCDKPLRFITTSSVLETRQSSSHHHHRHRRVAAYITTLDTQPSWDIAPCRQGIPEHLGERKNTYTASPFFK
ncbi:hypothetical protein ElyMa_004680300 [Elysia marginata]|uniref:Uncharacterized protein n=1 Tax=Elysia marginata TaxID=1093978 RepID=A0AAV4I4X7_9GAST|nr:hypothetical protein ElyMa_004680300 [Elysia marginata]